jgi:hypothetical protein
MPRKPTRKLYRVAFAPNQNGKSREGRPCRSRSEMCSMPKGSTFRVVPPYSGLGSRPISVCDDFLRNPGLKTSSLSLRRHDPDQVPRVSPSRGRLSALLGSPHLRCAICIISFTGGAVALEAMDNGDETKTR